MPNEIRRLGQAAGVALMILGIASVPDDLRNWNEAFSWLAISSEEGRWIAVIVGLVLTVGLQLVGATPANLAPAASSLVVPTEAPEKVSLPSANEDGLRLTTEVRDFVHPGITPSFLTALYVGRTAIQAEKLMESYKGKWLEVKCFVNNVDPFMLDRVAVIATDDAGQPHITLIFRRDRDKLEGLPLGANITAAGRIYGANMTTLTLDECELTGGLK